MVSHLSPVSMVYDIGKRMYFSRRHPNVVNQVEDRLYEQVVRQYATCIGRGAAKCNHLQEAIAKERAKPRRAGAGGLADTSNDSSKTYSSEVATLRDELRKYRFAAACAYIAGGKTASARAELAAVGFLFDEQGNISAPAEWQLEGLPTSQTEAVRGVPFRAKQVARSVLWESLRGASDPSTAGQAVEGGVTA